MISNLEYYRVFHAAATLGSATKAAESLHITQSGVSQTILKLEEELGVQLFIRSRRGMERTKAGEILYQHVHEALSQLSEGERIITEAERSGRITLSLGATETSIVYLLPDILKNLKEKNPDIRITMTGTTVQSLCTLLEAGKVEAAVLFSPLPSNCPFDIFPVGEVQDILIAAPDKSAIHTLSELSQQTLISVAEDTGLRTLIDQWFLSEGILFDPDIIVGSTGQILPLVSSGLGVGIVPEIMARKSIADGTVVRLDVSSLPEKRTAYFAVPDKNNMSYACRALFSILTTAMQ